MRAIISTCARKVPCFLYSPINRADTYLRPLSLHTIKNYAKISCIGLFPYGLFSFLYKEVFRYESFK